MANHVAGKHASKSKPQHSDGVAQIPKTSVTYAELVSQDNLKRTWSSVRREAHEIRAQDPINLLDWIVRIGASIDQLHESLLSGTYQPQSPLRYELPKAKGAFRVITVPNLKDALVYRVISDAAYSLYVPRKVKGAFFARRHSTTPVGEVVGGTLDWYEMFYKIWFYYHQYRAKTLLQGVYEVLVTTDITNYFDSIHHDLLLEYLSPLGLPREAVGLLGRLLETLKPAAGHSPNPKVGIPVDEYDCSRQLAHVFLFEYDRQIVKTVGEENFVRWMDDQNIGVKDMTQARQVINRMTRLLAEQRLTLNAGKTRFLNQEEVATEFQLEANTTLDLVDTRIKRAKPEDRPILAKLFAKTWEQLKKSPDAQKGHWEKIIKRSLSLATKCDSPALEKSLPLWLVDYPELADRLFAYLGRRNRGELLVDLFENYVSSGENLFEAVEGFFFDACLMLEPTSALRKKLVALAEKFCRGQLRGQTSRPFGRASAVICAYWFGASGGNLLDLFDREDAKALPSMVARAWLATSVAKKPENLGAVQGKLVGNPNEDVALLSSFLEDLLNARISSLPKFSHEKSRWPLSGQCFPPRTWLQFDLASIAGAKRLRSALLSGLLPKFRNLCRTEQEREVLARTEKRLSV